MPSALLCKPFQELVKHNSSFTWDNTLNQLFINSKDIIIRKVQEFIHTFDPQRHTSLQADWSKEGIGYLLLQKYFDCILDHMSTCFPEGWRLVFAGSRFTSSTKT